MVAISTAKRQCNLAAVPLAFAVGCICGVTYFTVSLLFWYMGLIPDLATIRDRLRKNAGQCKTGLDKMINKLKQFLYGLFSMGWIGSNGTGAIMKAYLLLAGLSTPLVLSVHSIVSFDFAVSQLLGWRPFSRRTSLRVRCSRIRNGADTDDSDAHHFQPGGNHYRPPLGTDARSSWLPVRSWVTRMGWSSSSPGMGVIHMNCMPLLGFGPYWWSYWIMISCNVISPQLFWFKWCRRTPWFIFVVSIFVNIGMWFERFVIVVTSLHRDYLPSSWGYYSPTQVDILYLLERSIFMVMFLLLLGTCRPSRHLK